MTLYSYRVAYDAGAAPNPFWGLCTLVICKPAIRRVATQGDWVVGLGTVNSPAGDLSRRVVYAMKVSKKLTMQDYDKLCRQRFRRKIPAWTHRDPRRRVGDCIYDFTDPDHPRIRRGVHSELNRETDLGGMNALISDHFYYFGERAIPLPRGLHRIDHARQGHRSQANSAFVNDFVHWIESAGYAPNRVHGDPALLPEIVPQKETVARCSRRDLEEDAGDERG